MPIPEQGKTQFIKALSETVGIPESELRFRIRSVSEAGLLSKRTAPFTDRHGVAILLALLASPTHADAGRIVPQFAALPYVGTGTLEDAPVKLTPRHRQAEAIITQALPTAFVAGSSTLGEAMRAILCGYHAGNAPYEVNRITVTQAPNDAATITIAAPMHWPPLAFSFSHRSGPAMRANPDPAQNMGKHTHFKGAVLAAVAPFIIPTIERKIPDETTGPETPARRRVDRQTQRARSA